MEEVATALKEDTSGARIEGIAAVKNHLWAMKIYARQDIKHTCEALAGTKGNEMSEGVAKRTMMPNVLAEIVNQ